MAQADPRVEVLVPGHRHQFVQPVRLEGCHRTSQFGQPEVLTPGIGGPLRGVGDMLDEPVLAQPPEGLVEATGSGFELAGGALLHVLADAVAVGRALPQGQ